VASDTTLAADVSFALGPPDGTKWSLITYGIPASSKNAQDVGAVLA